jgi:hypothetical protein
MVVRRFNGQLPVPCQQLASYTNQIGANGFGFPLPKGLTTTHDSHAYGHLGVCRTFQFQRALSGKIATYSTQNPS